MLGASYFIFMIVCTIVEIGLVLMLSKTVKDMAIEKAKTYYIAYSVINGIVLSMWLNYVVPGVAALAFAVTAVYFGLLYTVTQHTNNNFIGIGKVCLMALPVLMIAYILLIFFSSIACFNVVIIASCPATSLNVCGRYVLYNDLYAIFINSFPYYT